MGAGLLFAALAGCGSVVASSGVAAAPAATTSAPAPAAQVGCASVNQATAVDISTVARAGASPVSTATYRQAAQVQALFGQLCAAVTHPAKVLLMHCPDEFGASYLGTFYDGSQVLATFTFAASGCERVTLTVAGKTVATMVYGSAAAAAPQLAADLDAIIGAPKPGMMQPQGGVSPGGPNKPA